MASVRAELVSLRKRLARLDADDDAEDVDPAVFDWFAPGCPCGLPAGECTTHPRARPNQRPPEGRWGTWLTLAGRGFGKTRLATEWICSKIARGECRRVALVAPTAADVRDVLVEGPAGILAVSPPWFRPIYQPSIRRLTFPNGAIATTFSAEEPNRLRGPQHDAALADEVAAWPSMETLDNLLMGLRLGGNPQLCVTTTPRNNQIVRTLLSDKNVAVVRGTTYENRIHLAPTFFDTIVARFEGTRLGQQELLAEVLEVSDGAIWPAFDPARHIHESAEFDYRFPVRLAIDAGVSQHVGAVFFQVRPWDGHRHKVTVFADAHLAGPGLYSEAAAQKLKAQSDDLPSRGRLDVVRLDPAADAQTGIGPAAYGAFERVFGSRITSRWPRHRVQDGIDQVALLLDQGMLTIHPRCAHLKAAFQNYVRKKGRDGEFLDGPADPNHPHEDLADALRGGIRDAFPDGIRVEQPQLRRIHVGRLY